MTLPAANTSQLPLFHLVGFSGHRHLANMTGVATAIRAALESLRKEASGEWIALSSAAAGADLLFIRAALELKIGWEVSLPLPLADFERDFPPEEWPEVKALIARAEHFEVTTETGSRDEAYLAGGIEIVNRCDVLLVVWDGQPARGKGGTADVVAFARAIGRPLLILDPDSLVLRRERFETVPWQDANLHFLNSISGRETAEPRSSHDVVAALQCRLEAAATHRSPPFHCLIAIILWLQVSAAALATASLAFGWHWVGLPWGNLILLLGAVGVAFVVRTRRTQHDRTRCRLAAEITRSALATWGLPRAARLFADLDCPGLEPLRRSLEVLQRRATREVGTDFDTFRQKYLAVRIDGQLAQFASQETRAISLLARLRMGFAISSAGAIATTTLSAVNVVPGWLELPHAMEELLNYFAPIVLAVLAAVFISLISINHLHRRVARYRELGLQLGTVRPQIAHSQTWTGLERAVAKAERVLGQEVFERHSITSFTPSR